MAAPAPPYLGDDEPAGHSEPRLGGEVVSDHDPQASLREAEIGRVAAHDLIHHHHGAAGVIPAGLH